MNWMQCRCKSCGEDLAEHFAAQTQRRFYRNRANRLNRLGCGSSAQKHSRYILQSIPGLPGMHKSVNFDPFEEEPWMDRISSSNAV
jgi:hypothetical protein